MVHSYVESDRHSYCYYIKGPVLFSGAILVIAGFSVIVMGLVQSKACWYH